MPTEIRHIIFSSAEVLEAIARFFRQRGKPLPGGQVCEAGPADTLPNEPVIFRVVTAPNEPHATEPQRLDLFGAELTSALIGYCRHRDIPLPVKGSKSLERFGSRIGLIVSTAGRNP